MTACVPARAVAHQRATAVRCALMVLLFLGGFLLLAGAFADRAVAAERAGSPDGPDGTLMTAGAGVTETASAAPPEPVAMSAPATGSVPPPESLSEAGPAADGSPAAGSPTTVPPRALPPATGSVDPDGPADAPAVEPAAIEHLAEEATGTPGLVPASELPPGLLRPSAPEPDVPGLTGKLSPGDEPTAPMPYPLLPGSGGDPGSGGTGRAGMSGAPLSDPSCAAGYAGEGPADRGARSSGAADPAAVDSPVFNGLSGVGCGLTGSGTVAVAGPRRELPGGAFGLGSNLPFGGVGSSGGPQAGPGERGSAHGKGEGRVADSGFVPPRLLITGAGAPDTAAALLRRPHEVAELPG